jgi:hypothetical protein
MYAASTAKFVDYSDAQYRFRPPYLDNATFSPISGGWAIVLHWRIDNAGRLPMRIAIFQFEIAVDNRSDPRDPFDGAKLASEYHILLSIQLDRFTGPVVPAGGSRSLDWWVNETIPENVGMISPAVDPGDGHFYIVILDGVVVYYVADINERHLDGIPPSIRRV